jgi:HSP20 family protein
VSGPDVFAVFERRRLSWEPSVDVFYVDAPPRAVVHAELPGMDPASIVLEVRGRELVLSGTRPAADASGRLYQQVEIARGPFRRVVELGALVDADGAVARYEAGVLEVTLPLVRDEPRSRSVPVEVG